MFLKPFEKQVKPRAAHTPKGQENGAENFITFFFLFKGIKKFRKNIKVNFLRKEE